MKKRIFVVRCIICLLLSAGASLFAQDNSSAGKNAKTDDIRKLLMLTTSGKLGKQIMDQVKGSIKASQPKVPEKFWQEFIQGVNPDELIEMVIPIYDKYLTHEEIKQIIAFYDTPVGKKLIIITPRITRESTALGQTWRVKIAEKAAKKLKEQDIK